MVVILNLGTVHKIYTTLFNVILGLITIIIVHNNLLLNLKNTFKFYLKNILYLNTVNSKVKKYVFNNSEKIYIF